MALWLSFILFLSFSNFVSSDTHIVIVNKESKPSVFSEVEQWYKATLQTLNTNPDDQQTNNNILTHVYKTVVDGFSAKLTRKQAAMLSNKPGVMAVMPDLVRQLQTTRSPSFLGLYTNNNNNINVPGRLLSMSDSGSNAIIGVFDTGIWPEHTSFRDEGMGPVPSRWKGKCVEDQNFKKSLCNRKLIGARFFYKGHEEAYGKINTSTEILSARDSDGHGTHTSSTAAGRAVGNASLFGYAKGTAVGVAPKARIAAYKVCWENGCMDSDILSAFDKAVEDGVDIISLSIGGAMSNIDAIAIGAFGAMKRGVFVSVSAGNDGPGESSLGNVAPWMTTVGAGTIDRVFETILELGDGRVVKGSSIYKGKLLSKMKISIIYGGFCDSLLEEHAEEVQGKIVVCMITNDGDVYEQESNVKSAGGVAIVIVSGMGLHGENLIAYLPLNLPGLAVSSQGWVTIQDYIDHSSPNSTATIVFHGTILGIQPAPIVASFSSRGPASVSPFLMKPDLIAPGVTILAAYPNNLSPSGQPSDQRRTEFKTMSGTSMSCPHISGVAALLKGAHTDWTSAVIRSAMMTTAYTKDKQGRRILDSYDYTNATVWAMGAGHVDPEKALDPGLVYDISPDDYVDFLCASGYSIESIKSVTGKGCGMNQSKPWNLNYPAIAVDFNGYDKKVMVVTRTVTHVSDNPATYTVKVFNPKGVALIVTPMKMKFVKKGEKMSYNVRITAQRKLTVAPGESPTTDVGEIVWSDGKRIVVSPVVMNWKKDY